ncbi:MAG: transporter [Acidobacteriota bacterium]
MRHLRAGLAGIVPPVVIVMAMLWPAASWAQQPSAQPPPGEQDLAKQLSNPVSSLVSMPFQFNWEQNVGPDKQTRFILNVQPVMPFALNSDWNLIARVIVPFVSQPPLFDGGSPAFGVSDILASFFVSPSHSRIIWGVGPEISLPSTTITTLGTEKWSAGPTVVVVKQTGLWTLGALWNQIWSFSGNPDRADVNQMFLQPFLSYQATKTLTLTLQSETSANWEIDDGRWTIPINVVVSKLSTFGSFPASYQFGFGGFAVHPDTGPSWKVRSAIVILLPRRQ